MGGDVVFWDDRVNRCSRAEFPFLEEPFADRD